MKYVIMCGGSYEDFRTPKQLTVIHGEPLVKRTIRLLRENGVTDIVITATDPRFSYLGVPRLNHKNSFVTKDGVSRGYWLDAFYPAFAPDEKLTFLFGDVYYSENAIKTIVSYETDGNILFGNSVAKNEEHQNWGEPFAYIVNDYKTFMRGVRAVKRLQDEGKTDRLPIVWELYRYLNGLDINRQEVLDETYVCIDDETMDIDDASDIPIIGGNHALNDNHSDLQS